MPQPWKQSGQPDLLDGNPAHSMGIFEIPSNTSHSMIQWYCSTVKSSEDFMWNGIISTSIDSQIPDPS